MRKPVELDQRLPTDLTEHLIVGLFRLGGCGEHTAACGIPSDAATVLLAQYLHEGGP
jgi:hypothetical protein